MFAIEIWNKVWGNVCVCVVSASEANNEQNQGRWKIAVKPKLNKLISDFKKNTE